MGLKAIAVSEMAGITGRRGGQDDQGRAMSEITELLESFQKGEGRSAEELLPLVYDELRQLAVYRMGLENPGQTLQATALVHEAWMRVERESDRSFNDAHHFYCAAATAMRRILIDNARRKKTAKHGGHLHRTMLSHVGEAERMPSDDLVALDEALARLAEENAKAVRLVELRFFVGLGHQEAASIMGITRRQADGLWAYARAWLFEAVGKNLGANGALTPPE